MMVVYIAVHMLLKIIRSSSGKYLAVCLKKLLIYQAKNYLTKNSVQKFYYTSSLEGSPFFTAPSEILHWHDSIPALYQYQYTLVCGMERGRPDRANFRRLLWKCLCDIPAFAEPRSRILVPLFLHFIELVFPLFGRPPHTSLLSFTLSFLHSLPPSLPPSTILQERVCLTRR